MKNTDTNNQIKEAKIKITPMFIGKKLINTKVLESNLENRVINTRVKEGQCNNK